MRMLMFYQLSFLKVKRFRRRSHDNHTKNMSKKHTQRSSTKQTPEYLLPPGCAFKNLPIEVQQHIKSQGINPADCKPAPFPTERIRVPDGFQVDPSGEIVSYPQYSFTDVPEKKINKWKRRGVDPNLGTLSHVYHHEECTRPTHASRRLCGELRPGSCRGHELCWLSC